jgi:hypothetical protein
VGVFTALVKTCVAVAKKMLGSSGPSDECIDILTKYQSLSLRELKYRDMNGYSRYGLYKLHN